MMTQIKGELNGKFPEVDPEAIKRAVEAHKVNREKQIRWGFAKQAIRAMVHGRSPRAGENVRQFRERLLKEQLMNSSIFTSRYGVSQ